MSDKYVENFNIMGQDVLVRDRKLNKFYISSVFTSIDDFITFLGNNPDSTLFIDTGVYTISKNVTFPESMKLIFIGGSFLLSNGATHIVTGKQIGRAHV